MNKLLTDCHLRTFEKTKFSVDKYSILILFHMLTNTL